MEGGFIITEEGKLKLEDQMGKQLEEVQKTAGRLQEYLAEARTVKQIYDRCGSEFQYGRFTDCAMEASMCAERLTEKLRRLVLGSCLSLREKDNYRLQLVSAHGIRIMYQDGIVKLELPFLLPHRKNKYTDYIYLPCYTALQDWCLEREEKGETIPSFKRAILCFIHCYDKSQPKVRIRDHDNIEEKQVVDALGTFFLSSDNGLYLSTYHTTKLEERDRTMLFLMNQNDFPLWLLESGWATSGIEKGAAV